jgi:hypothetical protein
VNFPTRIITIFVTLLLANSAWTKTSREYLPSDADLDAGMPAPETVLGWEVGDWHVNHDKLVQYMQALAAASPRVSLKVIGHSYEQRPLLQLVITSAENQQNLESIRTSHLQGQGPLVIWLGYSVHGDEPSGSNASMLAAYYLASSQSPFVKELLAGSVILIDPSINPDGLNRYATWANSNAGSVPVADPVTRQHVQNWPKARTNHYWFDLNRDWLPLVHPSSRARITEFHRWLPHVLTDHHEQTGSLGFFFQPGVPSRQNPLTPAENLNLTRALALHHSAALDTAGQPHFTEDTYDDFYYGKGSTYPDINGSIGILFEQKAILGQELNTSSGTETFRMAIANHLRVSLSTLKGSWELRDKLIQYQAGFAAAMLDRAAGRNFRAWVIGDDADPARAAALLDVLELHRIEYLPLGETIRSAGQVFTPGHAWVIPARQRQFGLAEAMMETRTSFKDETFYDVSAWTQPLAYNLPFATLGKMPATHDSGQSSSGLPPDHEARAWAIPWQQTEAAPLLQKLLSSEARVQTALKPFSAQTANGLQPFQSGTLFIQAGIQNPEVLPKIIDILAHATLSGLNVHSLPSTLTATGPDPGSKYFPALRPIQPLIIGGKGTSSYGVGEQWFLLDQRLQMAAPIVELQHLESVNLHDYTHLLMADGDYSVLRNGIESRIIRWVNEGGVLLTINRAAAWAENLCFTSDPVNCETDEPEKITEEDLAPRAYSDFENDKSQQAIGGAIVSSIADLSHPLTFGYQRPELPLFRRGTTELQPSQNPYSTPVRYTSNPLMAGFIGSDRLEAIKGQPAVIAEKTGKGLVVRFANNPLFRGFWRGTEKLFVNALYFAQVVEQTEIPAIVKKAKRESHEIP